MEAGSAEEVWRVSQRLGSIWKYLVLQDVSRKKRMAGQDGGPWIGTNLHIIDGSVYQMTG